MGELESTLAKFLQRAIVESELSQAIERTFMRVLVANPKFRHYVWDMLREHPWTIVICAFMLVVTWAYVSGMTGRADLSDDNLPQKSQSNSAKEISVRATYNNSIYEIQLINSPLQHSLDKTISSALVDIVPASLRSYEPATSTWEVLSEYWPQVKTKLEILGFTIIFADVPTKVPVNTQRVDSLQSDFGSSISSKEQSPVALTRRYPFISWDYLANPLRKFEVHASKSLWIPLSLSIVALVSALITDWPYDFFVLLRVLIFVACIVVGTTIWKNHLAPHWFWLFATMAIVYNPLLPIHLHRSTWSFINVGALFLFASFGLILRPAKLALLDAKNSE